MPWPETIAGLMAEIDADGINRRQGGVPLVHQGRSRGPYPDARDFPTRNSRTLYIQWTAATDLALGGDVRWPRPYVLPIFTTSDRVVQLRMSDAGLQLPDRKFRVCVQGRKREMSVPE